MIVCCGEALIDMLPQRTGTGEACFVPHAGGAIFNAAIALGRLGARAGFLCGLSDDVFGEQLVAALRQSHVDTRYCIRSKRPTTLAFVELQDGQARYTFYDENSAARMLRIADLPVLNDDVSALLFGGISLLSQPCGATYEALAEREHASRLIMLDPNIRRDFIQDETAYLARLVRLFTFADIIKVSDEDLAWLAARLHPQAKEQPRAAIEGLLNAGVKLVLVTRGEAGAEAYTPEFKLTTSGRSVAIVDTIGAGDTFNGGIMASLHSQNLLNKQALADASAAQIEAALQFANKVAAITVSRAGANPPWAHELD